MTVIHWQFWRLDKELEFSSVAATVAVPLYGSPVPGSWSLARSRLVPSKRFDLGTLLQLHMPTIELGCTNGNLNVKASSLPLTTLAPRHARQRRRHSQSLYVHPIHSLLLECFPASTKFTVQALTISVRPLYPSRNKNRALSTFASLILSPLSTQASHSLGHLRSRVASSAPSTSGYPIFYRSSYPIRKYEPAACRSKSGSGSGAKCSRPGWLG
ncbi:hypothetical protein FOCG_05907 [Fusarium oxysporum f. sp. radicis-lycopersici 26381]|uniref:Uncharacterized protein n=1 Tax=Fusarium oxysporum Fo47 TaxID=660027 RepID=W9K197_FUSOX|nr:hypothetical protein FOZG_11571 [Fusarium oxysporum Fo47]EWZ96299.1 hypothetical protein FOWG_03714 [Fusarium oxysporum f. sp. lycopersici MN25]EXL55243.1 hypothetical protein FOCG_05907 [Fusarium oxysporum f. sp. radicis-lycopersici 26381]